MTTLLETIAKTDAKQIEILLKAVLERYEELFPEFEIATMSVSKKEDRNDQLDRFITMLQGMKTVF